MVFKIFLALVTVYVLIYTASYGVWELRHKNIIGSVAVFALCALVLALPVVTAWAFM